MTDPKREPPRSTELEQAVLGSLLVSNDLVDIAAAELEAEHS